MGITGLKGHLKKYAPQAIGEIHLDALRGTRVAIDALNLIYITYPNARKKVISNIDVTRYDPPESEIFRAWMNNLFDIIRIFVSYSITPVFVFDGERPKEKAETNRKRIEDRIKTKERMLSYKEEVRNMDPLLITEDMVHKLRRHMINTRELSFDSITEFKLLLRKLGIPNVQAKYEGEQLCAMYALEGVVSAVFSTDTDNLVYGVPFIITRIGRLIETPKGYMFTAECMWYENVLRQLDYTPKKFLDLCIMAGCDYNRNIPKIGIGRAWTLLNEYDRIEDLPSHFRKIPLNTSILKYERCREMFQPVPSESLVEDGFLDYDRDKLNMLAPILEDLMIFSNQKYLVRGFEILDKPVSKVSSLPPAPSLPEIKKCKNVILRIHS